MGSPWSCSRCWCPSSSLLPEAAVQGAVWPHVPPGGGGHGHSSAASGLGWNVQKTYTTSLLSKATTRWSLIEKLLVDTRQISEPKERTTERSPAWGCVCSPGLSAPSCSSGRGTSTGLPSGRPGPLLGSAAGRGVTLLLSGFPARGAAAPAVVAAGGGQSSCPGALVQVPLLPPGLTVALAPLLC